MKKAKRFNTRAFVAMMIVLSGVGLPLTGIANHFLGFSPLTLDRHAWMSAHNGLSIIFTVFSIWHVVINRRSLWKHVKRSTEGFRFISRESVLASVFVALSLLLFVGHAFLAGG